MKSKNLIVLIAILLLSAFQISSDLSGQSIVKQPPMYYGDTTRNGDPFSKDPSVIYYQGRYLLYYSMLSSTNPDLPKGWRNELPYVIWDSEKFPMKKLRH